MGQASGDVTTSWVGHRLATDIRRALGERQVSRRVITMAATRRAAAGHAARMSIERPGDSKPARECKETTWEAAPSSVNLAIRSFQGDGNDKATSGR